MTERRTRIPGGKAAEPVAAVEPKGDSLPNAIDIDPRTIRGPVLTRQGWVVPDESAQREADRV